MLPLADVLILSNGPGEVTTWVRPVVKALREQLGDGVRISVVLSPCPNASGQEKAIALSYPEVSRVQAAADFLPFLLTGKTAENWDWCQRGIVLFLGGDQFFAALIGKRLKYSTIIYAEWQARWHSLIDRFAVMKPEMLTKVNPKFTHKFTVVGDLMAEAGKYHFNPETNDEWIGILPGSKPAKLAQGVPFSLAVAEAIHQQRPQTRFVIPVAPTLTLAALARFANLSANPVISQLGNVTAELVKPVDQTPFLLTSGGLKVELYQPFPAYEILAHCRFCLTTVGANTAELGSLGIPAIVLILTQQLDAMRAWDGLPGILANLPIVGSGFAKLINGLILRQNKLYAWPNIWAGKMIIPELIGNLQPQEVADLALDWLAHPEKLEVIRDHLRQVRGEPGASEKLAQIVAEELAKT